MDDVRNRVAATRPPCVLTLSDLLNSRLTFLGNMSPEHLHRRLTYLVRKQIGIEIRNVMEPRLLLSIMGESDPLFSAIGAWFHESASTPHFTHSWGRMGVGVRPAAPAPPHLSRGSGVQELKVHDSCAAAGTKVSQVVVSGRYTKKRAPPSPPSLSPDTSISGAETSTTPKKNAAVVCGPQLSGAELVLRTAALRDRVLARGAPFPSSLRALRAKCGVTEVGASWPTLLAEEALTALSRLIDEDDYLLDIYQRAIMRDCADPSVGAHMAAHEARGILRDPDATIAAYWAAGQFSPSLLPGSKILLRYGLRGDAVRGVDGGSHTLRLRPVRCARDTFPTPAARWPVAGALEGDKLDRGAGGRAEVHPWGDKDHGGPLRCWGHPVPLGSHIAGRPAV